MSNAAFNAHSKICRLCSRNDGPFLNIFGTDMNMRDKIKDLLPFEVNEWDELPHKICFLCSAKITEYHDFVRRSIESQMHYHHVNNRPFVVSVNEIKKRWSQLQRENLPAKVKKEEHTFPVDIRDVKIVLTPIDKENKFRVMCKPIKVENEQPPFSQSLRIKIKGAALLNTIKVKSKPPKEIKKKPEPLRKRRFPFLYTKYKDNEYPIYPCVTKQAVVDHLIRMKLNMEKQLENSLKKDLRSRH